MKKIINKKLTAGKLEKIVDDAFKTKYQIKYGLSIPKVTDMPFGNLGKIINISVIFVDIRYSTKIVSEVRHTTAAKMFKAFMKGIASIATNGGGKIRAFNGDGVLVVFYGSDGPVQAVKVAGQISWYLGEVLKKRLDKILDQNQVLHKNKIEFDYGIGVDYGEVLVVRGGIKGLHNNDLVWVGNVPNYAAKLSHKSRKNFHIHITKNVYQGLTDVLLGLGEKKIWQQTKKVSNVDAKIYKSDLKLSIL